MTATVAGFLIAIQPAISLVLIAVIALITLSFITPHAAFTVLLVIAPMRTLFETESPLRLPLDIGQLLVIWLGFVWILHQTARRKPILPLTKNPYFLLLGFFLLTAAFSMFQAPSLMAWLNEWLKWVITGFMAAWVLKLRRWEWFVFGLVLAGIANAIIGIYIFVGGSGALHLLINDRFFRAFGTFGQPNPFGGFMGLLAPISLTAALGYGYVSWQAYRKTRRLPLNHLLTFAFYALGAGLIVIGVVISWSRGAWLGFGVSMLMILFALPRTWWHSLALLALVLAVSGVLWTSGKLPTTIVERINSATQEIFSFDDVRAVNVTPANYAVVERLAHWQAALNMARSNWWTGVGFGNYEVAYPQYQLISWDEPLGHAHNYYLNVLAEIGIIGFVGYIVFWGGLFWLTWHTRRHPDFLSRMIAIGLLGTWTYLAIHSLTDNLYVNNVFLHLGIMQGIVALLYHQTRQKSLYDLNDY